MYSLFWIYHLNVRYIFILFDSQLNFFQAPYAIHSIYIVRLTLEFTNSMENVTWFSDIKGHRMGLFINLLILLRIILLHC